MKRHGQKTRGGQSAASAAFSIELHEPPSAIVAGTGDVHVRALDAGEGRVLWPRPGRQGGLRLRQLVCLDDWNQMARDAVKAGRGDVEEQETTCRARENWSDGPWLSRNTRWRQTTLEKTARSTARTITEDGVDALDRPLHVQPYQEGTLVETLPSRLPRSVRSCASLRCGPITMPSNFSAQVRPALSPCHRGFAEGPCSMRPASPSRGSSPCDISCTNQSK